MFFFLGHLPLLVTLVHLSKEKNKINSRKVKNRKTL